MRRWYAIQSTGGREATVKRDIETRMANFGQLHNLGRIVVPTETKIEEKAGQKREVEIRVMPGYVFVHVNLTDDVWGIIKATKGVNGFLGAAGKPMPLSDEEIRRMLGDGAGTGAGSGSKKPATVIEFTVGDTITVSKGPLAGFDGNVVEVRNEARKLLAEVMIFERAVRTEFSFGDVARSS